MITWDAVQQIIRIVAYAVGGYFLGEAVTNGELFTAAVAGVLNVGAFVWWLVWQGGKSETPT